jgi:hypothetical protein
MKSTRHSLSTDRANRLIFSLTFDDYLSRHY